MCNESGGATAGWTPISHPGWMVWHVAETGSTNADLLAAAAADAPDRTVLVTDHQTAGRGRLDRRWDAPPGTNLLMSILFRDPSGGPVRWTRVAGLAAVAAAKSVAGADATLKWPNDVLCDGRKLAGVLAQAAPDGSVVVGIGVNVGWAPDGAARLGDDITVGALLPALLDAAAELAALPADELADRYRGALSTLGQSVRVELPAGEIVGRAIDIEPDGRLVVLDECAVSHRVDVGDVVHLRPSDVAGDA